MAKSFRLRPNLRNYSKPFRRPRVVTNEAGESVYHPDDIRPWGFPKFDKGKFVGYRMVNTTGVFGVFNDGAERIPSIVVKKKGLGGKRGRDKRRKRGGNPLTSTGECSLEAVLKKRAKIHTALLWGKGNPNKEICRLRKAFEHFTDIINTSGGDFWINRMVNGDKLRIQAEAGKLAKLMKKEN